MYGSQELKRIFCKNYINCILLPLWSDIKEEDIWNKDDKDKTKLKQLIEKVEYKNVVALQQWCNENPDANVNNTSNNLLTSIRCLGVSRNVRHLDIKRSMPL